MAIAVDIPCDTFTLDNGLRVLVHEDAAVPIVAVNVWYHVGSRHEQPGHTGLAHLFEHLMFEGSRNVPTGQFDRLLEEQGAVNNGSTSVDRTNYWETLPAHALELALFLEADRMGGMLPVLTEARFQAQRDIVRNERRQSYENRPYGLASELIADAAYAPDHPYRWPVIGHMADLDGMTLADALAFGTTWYTPAHASLAIAGDVRTADVVRLVEQWFGPIPAGDGSRGVAVAENVIRMTNPPTGVGSRRDVSAPENVIRMTNPPAGVGSRRDVSAPANVIRMTDSPAGTPPGARAEPGAQPHAKLLRHGASLTHPDDVQLERLYLVWHSPAIFAPGDAELDVAATILGQGRAARLEHTLVHERELAQSVVCYQASAQLGSTFRLVLTARPDVALDRLEAEALAILHALADEGPTATELERARNGIETAYVDALQTVGGFGGRADRLNSYLFFAGDPRFVGADLERYRALTPAAVGAALAGCMASEPTRLAVVPRRAGS